MQLIEDGSVAQQIVKGLAAIAVADGHHGPVPPKHGVVVVSG